MDEQCRAVLDCADSLALFYPRQSGVKATAAQTLRGSPPRFRKSSGSLHRGIKRQTFVDQKAAAKTAAWWLLQNS